MTGILVNADLVAIIFNSAWPPTRRMPPCRGPARGEGSWLSVKCTMSDMVTIPEHRAAATVGERVQRMPVLAVHYHAPMNFTSHAASGSLHSAFRTGSDKMLCSVRSATASLTEALESMQ